MQEYEALMQELRNENEDYKKRLFELETQNNTLSKELEEKESAKINDSSKHLEPTEAIDFSEISDILYGGKIRSFIQVHQEKRILT